jgi:hypothetical protein
MIVAVIAQQVPLFTELVTLLSELLSFHCLALNVWHNILFVISTTLFPADGVAVKDRMLHHMDAIFMSCFSYN